MEDSVWRWLYSEFRDYINSITDKTITIERALDTIRELKCLPKEYREYRSKTVQDIAFKNKEIANLFTALRQGMQPETLKLPYKIKDRERQLIDTLVEYTDGKIDITKAYAKVAVGHSPTNINTKVDSNTRSFYYWLEVAIAVKSENQIEDAGEIEIIGSINGTPSLDGEAYFRNGRFVWNNQGRSSTSAVGLRQLLSECGFATDSYFSQRRMSSIIFINLVTPCPEWGGSAGKSSINLELYENLIADTVSKLAYRIPSLRGKGIKTTWDTGLGGIYKPFLVNFLKERKGSNRHKSFTSNN